MQTLHIIDPKLTAMAAVDYPAVFDTGCSKMGTPDSKEKGQEEEFWTNATKARWAGGNFVSTIAETSLTIADVVYFMSSGFSNAPYFDSARGFRRLLVMARPARASGPEEQGGPPLCSATAFTATTPSSSSLTPLLPRSLMSP